MHDKGTAHFLKHKDRIYNKINDIVGGGKVISIIFHGSFLYGLDGDNSDIDIKLVYIPSRKDILTCNIDTESKNWSSGGKNSKNTRDDIDIEAYSIYAFMRLLKKSDSTCISMLYAPVNRICKRTPMWDTIIENRGLFVAKDMVGLLGFIKTQVNKYCDKGVRLKAATKVLNFLKSQKDHDQKLKTIWRELPEEKYLSFYKSSEGLYFPDADVSYYEVCGKLLQNTITIGMAVKMVENIVSKYGNRSISTMKNGGLDWKSISHAFRVATELTDLYENGTISYPINNFEYIKRIKNGELSFNGEVLPKLNGIMDDVNRSSNLSNFPDKINKEKVDDFLYDLIQTYAI